MTRVSMNHVEPANRMAIKGALQRVETELKTIKCPACWNDIPGASSKCPCCGFVLREETSLPINSTRGKDVYYPEAVKPAYTSSQAPNLDSSKNKTSKDKKIIITAVVAVILILAIGIGNGSTRHKKPTDTYSYIPSNSSGYSNYSTNVTTGNEGALNKALSYLNSSAFSYSGLIEQLEYEGFSNSEATYGADHCGADWKEQALKKAKSYLNSSAFSESGLQEQLEYEGFTSDQASYGVANCGANWKDQAVKKAASYLKSHSFTRSELIDQLEYEGFTYDQASYGVSQNGL